MGGMPVKTGIKVTKLFAGANTPEGFVSFFGDIAGMNPNRVFIIKGGPGVGKSTFMSKIANDLIKMGYDLEYYHCASDPDSLDAMVVPALGVAIMDGTAPHMIDPQYPGAVEELIHFGDDWNEQLIIPNRDVIIKGSKSMKRWFQTGHSQLKEAKIAYDEWKSYVRESLDTIKYRQLVYCLIKRVMNNCNNYGGNNGEKHYFSSAVTPNGIKDFAATCFKPGMKVYPIYGGPGSGAKEVLTRIAQIAQWQGLFTEKSHCPIEPESLDMVMIPKLDTVVINIWPPLRSHVPNVEGICLQEGIDLDTCLPQGGVIEDYREVAMDARKRFLTLLDKAMGNMARAKAVHTEIEGYYISAMDFEKIEQRRKEVLGRMLEYEKDF
jgi:hypothetical protein